MPRTLAAIGYAGIALALALCALARRAPGAADAQGLEAYRLAAVWGSDPSIAPPGYLIRPTALAAAEDGTVFVLDTDRGRIDVLRDGRFVAAIARSGSGPGELSEPQGIALLGNRLVVADTGNRRLQVFSPDGVYVTEWRGVGRPWDVAATADGQLLVTDYEAGRVLVLDASGQTIGALGHRGSEPGALDRPTGVTSLAEGRLAIVDSGNNRVQVWDASGMVWGIISSTTLLPQLDVEALGSQSLLVAELRTLVAYDVATLRATYMSRVLAPGRFGGVAVQPGLSVTSTIWATIESDGLNGLRRYDGSSLQSFSDLVALPSPAGELVGPRRIAADAASIAILDAYPRLQRLALNGSPIDQRLIEGAAELDLLDGDAVLANGNSVRELQGLTTAWMWSGQASSWYAALAADPAQAAVWTLDLPQQALTHIALGGSSVVSHTLGGAYQSYVDMSLRGDGRLLLVNRTARSIEVRDQDGTLVDQWPVRGVPLRVTVDASDRAYVLTREGWVWKLDAAGAIAAWWDAGAPLAAGERRGAPSDIAALADGRLVVADARADRLRVYMPDPTAPSEPPPSGSGCTFVRDKWAAPTHLNLGQTTGVTLTVNGICYDEGRRADIVLILDRSGSMAGQKMAAARSAAIAFVSETNFEVSRVGVVSFALDARQEIGLSADPADVVKAILALPPPGGGTDIGEAITVATQEVVGSGRPDAEPVIVVMTDGRPEGSVVDADAAAQAAKAANIRLISVGFGGDVDPELMRRIASSEEDYFFAPSTAELADVYAEIARRISGEITMRTTVITDVVPANMTYVPGSAEPPASYQDRTLRWELENVRAGLELRYRLQPQEVGTWPTNVEARSRYTDGHEVPGELVFPVPSVVVVGPALPIYLPFAARLYCVPAKQHADVVLVLDISSTMTGDKLASAKAAARRFLEVLHLPDDHAAVVSFSRQATLGAGLTGGRAALQDAIDGLAVIPGTAIDAGLRLAIDELGAHGRPDATHAIVLMTDGLNNDGRQPVLDAADSAHRRQVVLYTVAFGVDADVELMREVAGNPRRSFLALTGEDLIRIYTEIAGVIPCP